jgi:hypothetical protein
MRGVKSLEKLGDRQNRLMRTSTQARMQLPHLWTRDGFADQEIHSGETEEQDGSLVADRGVVEFVELDAARVGFRRVLHGDHFPLQVFHAVADGELRGGGQQHHKHHSEGRGCGETGETLRSDETRNKKNQPEKDSGEVEACQRETNHLSRGIAAAQNAKGSRGDHKTEECDGPQPQAQAQKLDGA